jgi:hypothetical protein
MKNKIAKYALLALTSVLLVTASCKKWIDPSINDSPDALTTVPMNLILPAIQVDFGFEAGTFDLVGYSAIFMNYFAGVDRQAQAYDAYTVNAGDVNNIWGSYYSGVMEDCKKLIDQANTPGFVSPYYSGIGKIMMATSLGNMTSVFGDIPYSEAFQGTAILQPKFDSQQAIYTAIQGLLDEAITELSVAPANNYYPVQNDLIYGGYKYPLVQWTKAAYTLKARYAMHLSKKGDAAAATAALAALANGLTSSFEDGVVPFSTATPTEYNPLFQFNDQRSGYIESDPDFSTLLTGDPRHDALANAVVTNNAWCQQNTPVPLITYTEAEFLLAEASLINGDAAGAAAAYNNGLTASLNQLGVFDQTWFDANKMTAATITRNAIITAKYIAICPSLEAFTDYRRTGFPVLTPNAGNNNGNVIPVRLPYPTNEVNYNQNTPKNVNLNTVPWAFQ